MKTIQKLLLTFLIMSCAASLNAQQNNAIIIEPKYPEITDIISTVHQKLESTIGFKEDMVFGMNIYKDEDIYIIEITFFYKKDFEVLLGYHIKKDACGFFYHENIPVIVFGESANKFFTKTDSTSFFEWFKAEKTEEVIYISAYEPPVWTYEFDDNTFNFKGTSYSLSDKW